MARFRRRPAASAGCVNGRGGGAGPKPASRAAGGQQDQGPGFRHRFRGQHHQFVAAVGWGGADGRIRIVGGGVFRPVRPDIAGHRLPRVLTAAGNRAAGYEQGFDAAQSPASGQNVPPFANSRSPAPSPKRGRKPPSAANPWPPIQGRPRPSRCEWPKRGSARRPGLPGRLPRAGRPVR